MARRTVLWMVLLACIVCAGSIAKVTLTVTVRQKPHQVVLNWIASPTPNVSYRVYRSEQTGGPYSIVSLFNVVGTTWTDTMVTAGKTYYYVVSSVDQNGLESLTTTTEATAVIPTP